MFKSKVSIDRRSWLAGCTATAATTLWPRNSWSAEKREVPWLAEIQRPPAKLPAEPAKLTPLLVDGTGQPITTLDAWGKRREELRSAWQEFLGSLGLDTNHCPAVKVLKEELVSPDQSVGSRGGKVVRQHVSYEIEPGITTEAYLLRPEQIPTTAPGVAAFHSTINNSILQPAGLGKDAEKAFGLKVAQRGCIAICPRNYLWPDNQHIAAEQEAKRFLQRHPKATGMAKMLYDSLIAVNILAAQPGVDPKRLGAVGHSLGAKEVLYLAAFDERIQATVSSEGGIGTKFSNWDASWYLGAGIKKPTFTREHHELLALVAPRAFLLIGGESADGDQGWPFIAAALPVYRLYGQPARLGQYNHRQGHAVPPECEQRIYEWLETYL